MPLLATVSAPASLTTIVTVSVAVATPSPTVRVNTKVPTTEAMKVGFAVAGPVSDRPVPVVRAHW